MQSVKIEYFTNLVPGDIMMKTRNINHKIALAAIILTCCGIVLADEYYAGGVTVDIGDDVLGYLWVEDATVNLIDNAHIVDDLFFGDIYATSGSVINIYRAQIDGYLYITTSGNGMPESQVTVFGTDFAVDGVPVDPEATELFLQGQELSGVYADGTPFTYMVDCAVTADFYLTVKLGWLESAAKIELDKTEIDFGQVDLDSMHSAIVTIANTGNANLTLQSVSILRDENVQFSFVPLQQMPITIEPETVIEIEVVFSPIAEGIAEAVLQIASDDPNRALIDIDLVGEGMLTVLTAEEQIDLILEYYTMSLEDGSIAGVGNRRASRNKALLIGKKLILADRLIRAGRDKQALRILKVTKKLCSHKKMLTGEGVPGLNEMLDELIGTLRESIASEPKPQWQHKRKWGKR